MKKLRYIFFILGLVLAGLIVYKTGWENIIKDLMKIRWWFIAVLVINLAWYILYTLGWEQFLRRKRSKIHFLDLLKAKIAGEAINTSSPASFIGGDPIRIYMLKKHFPTMEAAASVVVDRTIHSMSVVLIIFVGAVAAFWKLPFIPTNMRFGVPIVLAISIAFMAFVYIHQHRGFFSYFMMIFKKIGIKKNYSQKTIDKFESLDEQISNFYLTNKRGFWIALLFHFSGRLLGVLEFYVIGKCFDLHFTMFAALLLAAVVPIVCFIFTFIPAQVGVLEGASSVVLYMLNIKPSLGVSIQVIRRLRTAIWLGIGYILLSAHDRKRAFDADAKLSL